ncbi:peptidylprolyl isomerase [Anseongella ginsenosidimutans]|uniref:Peptidyl-prolyl cis-trans isomerase n=1 Tax=Anseongella ginsenosidimutans TaxID=496056 RepID=A0A4R3KMC7_9SPHI|nr:FKBP-type peptidyl-prolyl cis-trans isomerase [Anseongella ginsenosidimutans]QEC54084.1 FKBP-type peptidyl-prolyl cis-trans isomerase [Anseongella ginsenosidimutans]TCS85146.1 peptidylprolyl isomerase [Anseongella ginsenosidimutans]
MNSKITCILLAAGSVMVGCGKSGTTDDGLSYKIHTKNNGKEINEGDYVKFHLVYKTENDSVLQSSYDRGTPFEALIDSMSFQGAPTFEYLYHALKMMTLKDSATFHMKSDSLFSTDTTFTPGMAKPPRPPFIRPGSNVTMVVKVEEVKTKEEIEQELKEKRDKQTGLEADTINQYIEEHDLEVKKTPAGIQYHISNETDGPRPTSGDTVVVHYTGTLLDGTKFDSSYDRGEPISFALVKGAVIDGWYEGIPLFRKGEKGILIIPSAYGYGEFGSGPIPSNSPLVFEVELVDIKPKK